MNITIGRNPKKCAEGVITLIGFLPFRQNFHPLRSLRKKIGHRTLQSFNRKSSTSGSVLLEVVLALALFVAAATIVSSGLRASVQSVDRLRQTARAEDLAISVLSELQLGLRPLETGSAQPLPSPFEEWTCEIITTSGAEGGTETSPSLATVEVAICHPESETVRRLTQTIRVPQLISPGLTNEPSGGTSSSLDSGGSFP